ncbi:MAG TPA: glycoside hydrolase family 55 protein [Sedimentisphaerales bacterium]|jgi:hypothetical protein|nr:glycoside hydrolase family 55 protein [Sedimentisphaerales bacterium]HNU31118.1 glycoside hydrolase family 55 protein [Sedimentisphaerales bacterium]
MNGELEAFKVRLTRHSVAFCLVVLGLSIRPAGAQAAAEKPLMDAAISAQGKTFPVCESVVDVTKPPYEAKGDGQTDDTDAIQKALSDLMGAHKILYFPNGTYLVSRTLRHTKKDSRGSEAWGHTWLQGQSQAGTIIRLKDGVFTDAARPQPILWGGGFGSADWFHNYIQNVTFDVGRNNPGAIGLSFYSNNSGAIRDVQFVSQDGDGAIGLDLGNDMNGPLFIRNITIRGFAIGIRTAHSVNSQTFEGISLIGQSQCGFTNDGQSIAIRGLYSENAVTALRASGFTCLLDSRLVGRDGASRMPAIELGETSFLARNVDTSGYHAAIRVQGGRGEPGPAVAEYMTGKPTNPFGGPVKSLNLPVEETPDVPWDDADGWARIEATASGAEAASAVQAAIDSGATSILLGHGLRFRSPVIVRGKVRRITGTGGDINYGADASPDFIIEDGESPVIVLEHLAHIGGGILIDTGRTVVLRSLEARIFNLGRGNLFMEDLCTDKLRINLLQNAWARQLNVENQGTHLTNEGGRLWILGYKTERGGTLIHTKDGGQTELFGTFSYTTTAGKLAPMFVTEDASTFVYFNEVCYTGDPFATLVCETRDDVTKTVQRGQGGIAPYIGRNGRVETE